MNTIRAARTREAIAKELAAQLAGVDELTGAYTDALAYWRVGIVNLRGRRMKVMLAEKHREIEAQLKALGEK